MPIMVKQHLITDSENIQKISGYALPKVNKLLQLNRGPDHANMLTHGLYAIVRASEVYQVGTDKLSLCQESSTPVRQLEQEVTQPLHIHTPPYTEIDAHWDYTPAFSGSSNNILGDNGALLLNQLTISIPCITATKETLAYYQATLIKPGEFICFPDPIYPIWSMTIQQTYVADFLMTEQGGGFYLEYHQDQPHYHHAIHGGGYYLLARWNETKTKLQMTGFRIPNGHAVYTNKNAIHCDAALTGDYLVGYTTSENCSTVLFRLSKDKNQMVDIKFLEIE